MAIPRPSRLATRFFLVRAICVCSVVVVTRGVMAERPSAPGLLPKSTLAYVRVADSRELIEAFSQTSVGRLGRDDKIRPLVMQLYGSAAQAFARVQDEIGVSLDELLKIPQGEVCVAVAGRAQGPPAIVFLMDVGENLPTVRRLLEAGERQALRDGRAKRTDEVDGVTVTIFGSQAAYCDRDGTFVFSSSPEFLRELLQSWSGDADVERLADNLKFTTIMRSSLGAEGERPQVTWFVDPIELVEQVTRESGGAQIALAMLPLLGLDGVKAAGGSMVFSTAEFDSISHMHLLLDSPRKGILNMLAITTGEVEPEDWVPQDAASYMTIHWDLLQTLNELEKLVDAFRGEGAFRAVIRRRMSDPLGVDFQKEILDQLANRATHVSWFEKPARVNSGANLIGIKLKDARAFQRSLDVIFARVGGSSMRKSFRGSTYYEIPTPNRRQDLDQMLMRRPTPCLGIVGDYLLASDSVQCLEAAISAKLDPSHTFSDELEYKLIASRIQGQLGSRQAGMIAFQRPEESFRSFYDLATSPTTRRRLDELAPSNPALRALNDALRDNPLPPFSVIAKYLAPGGGMLISDASGLHYTTFGLKRQ